MRVTALVAVVMVAWAMGPGAQPAAAYWDDVHYGLTYLVAREMGFTPEQAYRIAAADLSIDYDPNTEPTQMSKMDYVMGNREDAPEKQKPRWMFHAFRDETNPKFKGAIGNDPRDLAADDAIAQQLNRLVDAAEDESSRNPGVYLHFYQDEVPHKGFGSAFGHYFDSNDPVGSTKKARDSGLSIGGAVDWLSFHDTDANVALVEGMRHWLAQFMQQVSPRQHKRDLDDPLMAAALTGLRNASPSPGALTVDELKLYVAYVTAANGAGVMPALTPAQQKKFKTLNDGPDLVAAHQAIAAAMRKAGMVEMATGGTGLRDYVAARTAFHFEPDGKVKPEQINDWVITGSLKITVEGGEAGKLSVVVIAPSTMSGQAEYELTKPIALNLGTSVTLQQIPIGSVIVEVRNGATVVARKPDVRIEGLENETTISLGPKPWVWVMKAGYPKIDPEGKGLHQEEKDDTYHSFSIREILQPTTTSATYHYKGSDIWGQGVMMDHDITAVFSIDQAPPRVLRWEKSFHMIVSARVVNQSVSIVNAENYAQLMVHGDNSIDILADNAADRASGITGSEDVIVGSVRDATGTHAKLTLNRDFEMVARWQPGSSTTTDTSMRLLIPNCGTWLKYQWEAKQLSEDEITKLLGQPVPSGGGATGGTAAAPTTPAPATGGVTTGPTAPAGGNLPTSTLATPSGTVKVQTPGGAWQAPSAGMDAPPGSVIQTGADGSITIQRPGGKTVTLGPNTVVSIDNTGQLHLKGGSVHIVRNGQGTAGGTTDIQTPMVTVTDTQTDYTVTHDEATGATTVTVTEGEVLVTPENASVKPFKVAAGHWAKVAPAPGTTTPSLPPTLPTTPAAPAAAQGWLGIIVQTVAVPDGRKLVQVWAIPKDNPVQALLQPGDYVLAADGVALTDVGQLAALVAAKTSGQTVSLQTWRSGPQATTVSVTLGGLPLPGQRPVPILGEFHSSMVTGTLAGYLDPVRREISGVLVGTTQAPVSGTFQGPWDPDSGAARLDLVGKATVLIQFNFKGTITGRIGRDGRGSGQFEAKGPLGTEEGGWSCNALVAATFAVM